MAIRVKGRAIILFAAGIWMYSCGPFQPADAAAAPFEQAAATTTAKPVALIKLKKHARRTWKKHAAAPRKSKKIALRLSQRKAVNISKMEDGETPSVLPAEVANANAQLASPNTSAPIMTARATQTPIAQANPAGGQTPQANDTLVSADQLNDLDRALTETKAPPPLLVMAAASTPRMINASMMASSDDSAWSKTSIIGKIFIAFGGMLTLASAARMFMA